MPDSAAVDEVAVTARRGKGERLIAAACKLMYRQGVERTTLADIAQAADVPLGNVYYYFKTKDDVVAAVVQAHVQQIETATAALDRRHRSPKARLKALVSAVAERVTWLSSWLSPIRAAQLSRARWANPSSWLARPDVFTSGSRHSPRERSPVRGAVAETGKESQP
jgi:AcrR family transcriptional regulator